MEPFSADHLSPWLPTLNATPHLYVGFSGGLDSSVLLHALCSVMPVERLTAIHINHGLSTSSDDWQAFCRLRCEALGIAMVAEKVLVIRDGEGLEQAARDQRYAVFTRLLGPGDLLLMAHHRDDQVETVLYRLLRGSGPDGLAGIPVSRPLGAGQLLRPLLEVSRSQLEAYAQANGLDWIEDESNAANHFDRNFLRNEVLPLVASRWPDYRERIGRSAGHCQGASELLNEVAQADLDHLGERPERCGWSISLPALAALSALRQRNLLRAWIRQKNLPVPGHRVIEAVLDDLLPAQDDARPLIDWGGGQLRRYAGRVFLLPGSFAIAPLIEPLSWDGVAALGLPGGFILMAEADVARGLRLAVDDSIEIRFRRGGERCKPVGRGGSATLKKLLQEYRLEPWLRDIAPLVYINGELAAVADLFVCADFVAGNGEGGIRLRWVNGR